MPRKVVVKKNETLTAELLKDGDSIEVQGGTVDLTKGTRSIKIKSIVQNKGSSVVKF
jgi:DNA/RNA endonuclease YhcR with UshA esterase domain